MKREMGEFGEERRVRDGWEVVEEEINDDDEKEERELGEYIKSESGILLCHNLHLARSQFPPNSNLQTMGKMKSLFRHRIRIRSNSQPEFAMMTTTPTALRRPRPSPSSSMCSGSSTPAATTRSPPPSSPPSSNPSTTPPFDHLTTPEEIPKMMSYEKQQQHQSIDRRDLQFLSLS